MPFTLAHPAAAVPLLRPMGRMGVLSALVIGSIAPDLWYVLPLAERNESHSLAGLVTYCLPVGLLLYLVFHAGLKRPLLELFPPHVGARLRAQAGSGTLPDVTWPAVMLSLVVGAATHVAWDSITHLGTDIALFHVGDVPFRLNHLLQFCFTALGLGLLCSWCLRWLRQAPSSAAGARERVDPRHSVLLGAALSALASIVVAVSYLEVIEHLEPSLRAASGVMRSLLVAALVVALAYAAAWHLHQARRTAFG